MFTHEKFEAYQISIGFAEIAIKLIDRLPPGSAVLREQLRRAAFSVPLNIAEGTGTKIVSRIANATMPLPGALQWSALPLAISLG